MNSLLDSCIASLARVRAAAPLVQNITNYVVMNSTANALLALGASPAMVHAPEEVEEFVAISGALVVNPGTLSAPWISAMHLACAKARALGKPWVLDPVGAGATRLRTSTAVALMAHAPSVLRCNASELLAVAGAGGSTKGVDSTDSADAAGQVARAFAKTHRCVAAVSGEVDYITDGNRVVRIANGHPLMPRVTGLGCTATALTGAFLAVEGDALVAASAALLCLGIAGELAAEKAAGPGTLQLHLLDALHTLDEATLRARARMTLS
jgi:hydroxyethylthiazole kinase